MTPFPENHIMDFAMCIPIGSKKFLSKYIEGDYRCKAQGTSMQRFYNLIKNVM